LEENNIPYQDLNVAEDKDARNDMIKKSGQMGVPVIDVYDKILVGYNESKLKEALNI
jgi:glutaredoxin